MNADEIVVDLGATVDFIRDQVAEQAETFGFEDAVRVRTALEGTAKAVKDAQAVIEGELVRQLEGGARQIGDKVYARKRAGVMRYNHGTIAGKVQQLAVDEAVDRETGEANTFEAVRLAVQAMRDLYISPSTQAKVGALEARDIEPGQVREWESRGYKLEVIQTEGPEE